MIIGADLGSLTESAYLGIPYTDNYRKYTIAVNPEQPTYIVGKTIIINKFDYPHEKINLLVKNGNSVISRIYIPEFPEVRFDPYIPRLNTKIVWNGETIETLGEREVDNFESRSYYSYDSDILFFPKVKNYRDKPGLKGEYNYIGYLLYQTGLNLYETEFNNLDIVKCMKGIF